MVTINFFFVDFFIGWLLHEIKKFNFLFHVISWNIKKAKKILVAKHIENIIILLLWKVTMTSRSDINIWQKHSWILCHNIIFALKLDGLLRTIWIIWNDFALKKVSISKNCYCFIIKCFYSNYISTKDSSTDAILEQKITKDDEHGRKLLI